MLQIWRICSKIISACSMPQGRYLPDWLPSENRSISSAYSSTKWTCGSLDGMLPLKTRRMEETAMRGLLRMLMLPLQMALGIVIGICRFFCICSVTILSVVSSVLCMLSMIALIIGHVQAGALGMVGAFLISPLGLPKVAGWLIDRMNDLRTAITAI